MIKKTRQGAMSRHFFLTLSIIALQACSTTQTTYGADGRSTHIITCSASDGVDMISCFVEAGDICKERGYDVVNQELDVATNTVVGGSEGYIGSMNAKSVHVLMVACN